MGGGWGVGVGYKSEKKKKAEPYLDSQQIFCWVPDIKIFKNATRGTLRYSQD